MDKATGRTDFIWDKKNPKMGFAINLGHLRRYIKTDGGYAEMSDGSKIEISRRRKDDFLAKITP